MIGLRRLWHESSEAEGSASAVQDRADNVIAFRPTLVDEADPAPADDQSLDAFVRVLRGFGQHAFDIEGERLSELSQRCEAWARHLLILALPPGDTTAEDGLVAVDADQAGRATTRDWASVVRFIVGRRPREQQYVSKALRDLRQSMWSFAQALGGALIEDQETDTHLQTQINRLKVAVESLSPTELKLEVAAAALDMSRLVSERQKRQRERLTALGNQVTELTDQLQEAKQDSIRDALTQICNRKGLDEFLSRMVFMRDVFAETSCLMMIDVDDFKHVNDTYGHAGGDVVLKALADCDSRNFPRKCDLVARYGGEEFAVVLPTTTTADGKRLAERMLRAVQDLRISHQGQWIGVTASVGVSQLGRTETVQEWLERTDQALYRAKAEGRNRIAEAED
jgi:diguanylate cyclase (GGDEF)-like protein